MEAQDVYDRIRSIQNISLWGEIYVVIVSFGILALIVGDDIGLY